MTVSRPLVLWLAAALIGAAAPAFAHAMLERAEPAVGSTVASPPKEIRLFFSEKLEPAFSSVHVTDSAGNAVDRGDTGLDPGNASALRVSLGALKPGLYRVKWRAVSVDTHVTEGDFAFTVAP